MKHIGLLELINLYHNVIKEHSVRDMDPKISLIYTTSKSKEMIKYLILLIIYRIGMDWAYQEVVSTLFAYNGFTNNYSVLYAVISWTVLLFFSFLSFEQYCNDQDLVSNEILFVLFLMSFVPFTTMICFGAVDNNFIIGNILFWLLLFVIPKFKITFKSHWNLSVNSRRVLGDFQIKIIAILFSLIILYISLRYTHFRINLSILNVYDLRSEAANYNWPTILTYLFSWTRSVNSILIAYFIRKKKWIWTLTTIVIQILNFSIDGLKSTLFLLLFAVIINMLPIMSNHKLNRFALLGFSGISIISPIIYKLFNNILPISLFARRMLLIPVRISSNYFDFFSQNTPDYFRQSFLRLLGFKSPYPPISYYISEVYEKSTSNSNNGLIADAMTNLGYIGIIIFPIMIFIVLKILDKSAKGLDSRIYLTVALYTALVMTNSFLFRVLFTHGLIIVIIILRYMDRDSNQTSQSG